MRAGWRGRVSRVLAGGLSCLLLAAAATAAEPGSARTPLQWLADMQRAVLTLDYSGSVVLQRGDEVRASRILQRVDGASVVQRVQMLDGTPVEFIRHRGAGVDEVRRYLPDARRIVIERRVSETRFPTIFGLSPAEIARNYELKLGPEVRVAGHTAQVLELHSRDALRHSYKVWAEQRTGLPLRLLVLEVSKPLELIGFTSLQIGTKPAPEEMVPAWPTAGWQTVTPAFERVDPAALGWQVVPPPGFELKSAVLRRLSPGSGGAEPSLQLFFTDGLAQVSVFIESASKLAPAAAGVQGTGAVSVATRNIGPVRVTAVGEVTAAGALAAAQSVEFRGRPAAATQGGSSK